MSAIPYGFCHCGCGERTNLAPYNDVSHGWVKGQPFRFVHGHSRRKSGVEYIVDAETSCWEWQRTKHRPGGYGRTTVNGRGVAAHVALYERHVGPVPEGLELDHLCCNKGCVNPDHLEPVTHGENVRRAMAKLTPEQVLDIRQSSEVSRVVAERYGIAAGTVRNIRCGHSWAHLGDELQEQAA